jgi:hypothetical protein
VSSPIKDGGPAFPRTYNGDGHNGMTLRDYFAAHAEVTLDGITGNDARSLGVPMPNSGTGEEWAEWRARMTSRLKFMCADAMLRARESEN